MAADRAMFFFPRHLAVRRICSLGVANTTETAKTMDENEGAVLNFLISGISTSVGNLERIDSLNHHYPLQGETSFYHRKSEFFHRRLFQQIVDKVSVAGAFRTYSK